MNDDMSIGREGKGSVGWFTKEESREEMGWPVWRMTWV